MKHLSYSVILLGSLFLATGCGKSSPVTQANDMKPWRMTASEVAEHKSVTQNSRGLTRTQESPTPGTCEMVAKYPEDFAGATCDSSQTPLKTLLGQAAIEIMSGIYAGNNVYAVGISHSITSEKGISRCAYVQIQERYLGKILAHHVLTPPNQPANCSVKPGSYNFYGVTVGFFGKIGNNVVGGVGAGFGWAHWDYFSPVGAYIPIFSGCLGGAAGAASAPFNLAVGVAGYTCGRIPLI